MAKPKLGDKHICPNCETRYFDMGNTPPTCPKCGTVIETGKPKAKAKADPVEEKVETPAPESEEALDAELDIDLDIEDDIDNDDDDDDLMEDASDLGGDDDMPGVVEPVNED